MSLNKMNKKKTLRLDKTDETNNINNTIPNKNKSSKSIVNKLSNDTNKNISQSNEVKNKVITNRIMYSITESDINPRKLDIPKGIPTEFNRNLNGEIKLNNNKQDKTVVCWNCQSLLLVKEGWQIVECSECNKLNRIHASNNINETRQIDLAKSYGNLKQDVPYMYGIVQCPMCETENKFSKHSTNINCYKCGFNIILKDSPFNNGINDISRSYDFTRRNYGNYNSYGYINPPPYNPNVIQIRGIIPMPPMVPYYNNDYTLLKILELLQKKPKKTYVPYPMVPYYRFNDEPKQQITYIPYKEKKEPKNEDFKITIRKKPKKFSYNKNEFKNYNKDAFERVFYTKLK